MAVLLFTGCASQPAPAATPAASLDSEAQQFLQRVEQAPVVEAAAPPDVEVQWATNKAVAPAAPAVPDTALEVEPAKPQAAQPPAPVEIAATVEIAPPAPAAPAAEPEPLTLRQLVDQLAARLEDKYQSDSPELRAALAAAAMSLADPARELTEKDLLSLTSEDRHLVLTWQRAFTRLGRSITGADAAEDRQALRLAAEELNEQLHGNQKLRIRRAELCVKVNGYGIYTPFPSHTFLAGREHPVIVYAELDNFRAEAEADGLYTVRLTQEIVVYNEADGLAVWRVKPVDIVDRSRNRRRDFFLVQIVQLPDRLSVGKYIMSLTVTDQHGQALDEAKIPIQIVADSSALSSAAP